MERNNNDDMQNDDLVIGFRRYVWRYVQAQIRNPEELLTLERFQEALQVWHHQEQEIVVIHPFHETFGFDNEVLEDDDAEEPIHDPLPDYFKKWPALCFISSATAVMLVSYLCFLFGY